MNETNETVTSEILARLNKEQAIIMIPSTILVIITMVVGLIGNSLTCYVYGFRLKMTPTYLFVVMLAIVDLITCVIITPGRIVQNIVPLLTTWDGMCKNHMILSVFTGLATCWFLMAIAVDRYRKLCCPLKTQISMKGAKIITLLICLFCATQGGIVTLYYGSVKKPTKYSNVFGRSCSSKITKKVNYYQLGFFAFYLLFTVFTIIVLIVLYSIVLHTMKKIVNKNQKVVSPSKTENLHGKFSNVAVELKLKDDPNSTSSNISTQVTNCKSNETLEEIVNDIEENVSSVSTVQTSSSSGVSSGSSSGDGERTAGRKELVKQETRTRSLKRAEDNVKRLNRTTVTMMMIAAVFVVTYIPSISAMMVNAAVKAEQKMGTAAAIFYWLARHTFYISSCLNPVIYGYRNQNFMEEVRLLFRKFKIGA